MPDRNKNLNFDLGIEILPIPEKLATLESKPIKSAERRVSTGVRLLEDFVKVPLFRCQRCGECILSHTAFICYSDVPNAFAMVPVGEQEKVVRVRSTLKENAYGTESIIVRRGCTVFLCLNASRISTTGNSNTPPLG